MGLWVKKCKRWWAMHLSRSVGVIGWRSCWILWEWQRPFKKIEMEDILFDNNRKGMKNIFTLIDEQIFEDTWLCVRSSFLKEELQGLSSWPWSDVGTIPVNDDCDLWFMIYDLWGRICVASNVLSLIFVSRRFSCETLPKVKELSTFESMIVWKVWQVARLNIWIWD